MFTSEILAHMLSLIWIFLMALCGWIGGENVRGRDFGRPQKPG